MKLSALNPILEAVQAGDYAGAAAACCDVAARDDAGPAWQRELGKLAAFCDAMQRDDTLRAYWSVFAAHGNSKLPFVAFSALPGRGFCPGAGACLSYCYSFRAWRYPAAFCRQVQNTLLLNTAAGRDYIAQQLDKFERKSKRIGAPITLRLYVDGDFRSVADVDYWQSILAQRAGWIRAYGYSKSFAELLAYRGAWTSNYLLNLSGGHRHDNATLAAVSALPISRGTFSAVSIGRKVKSSDHGTRETNAALRAAYGAKAFTCPGKCGSCTPKGHACGSDAFRSVSIIIAVH